MQLAALVHTCPMKPSFLIASIGLALAVIFALQYWLKDAPPPAAAEVPLSSASEQVREPVNRAVPANGVGFEALEPALPLPKLDASDGYVRELLGSQAIDQAFPQEWLDPEQLLRRVATLLDNAAVGSFPKGQLGFMAPEGDFAVTREGRHFRVDPQSYTRFDGVVAALESFEVQTLASLYRRLEPLLSEALAELGQSATPDELLSRTVAVVAQVPLLDDDVVLVRPNLLYQYQDPALEKLSPLQKQLLRMGPDNVARIQGYLVELADVLGLGA